GTRGVLPGSATRFKTPLVAGALLVASRLVLFTGGVSSSLATVGIAAWGMAECFGLAIGAAGFLLAAASAALALTGRNPGSVTIGGAMLATTVGALRYFYSRSLPAMEGRRDRRGARLGAHI